ncbi:MAG: N-acetylneuraminate synthase family protein [Patescibacteria group bacterium]
MIQDVLQLDKWVFIVAEIGKNFIQTKKDRPISEYLQNAKLLISAAKEAGADAVKFQTHNVEDEQLNIPITAPHFSGADRYAWVKRNTEATPLEFWQELKKYADELGIVFFSTPMSRGAAEKINDLVSIWKVGSGDMLDFVLLDYLAETKKPVIISTGMSVLGEVDKATLFLRRRSVDFAILHCASKYPAQSTELVLEMIPNLSSMYHVPVGFSDHSLEIWEAAKAVSLGARIIEKHFTMDRGLWGSDHKVSLTQNEFKQMVQEIRKAKIGSAVRSDGYHYISLREIVPIPGEEVFLPVFRKSLMAGQDISAGTIITKEMLYAMRPQQYAGGLPSEQYKSVLGKRVTRDFKKYDPITEDVLASS